MAVDLPAFGVTQDEARRPLVVRSLELTQCRADAIDVLATDAEVEIVVRTGLLPEQRVDAPPSFDPELDSGGAQTTENVDDVLGVHQSTPSSPPTGTRFHFASVRSSASQTSWIVRGSSSSARERVRGDQMLSRKARIVPHSRSAVPSQMSCRIHTS